MRKESGDRWRPKPVRHLSTEHAHVWGKAAVRLGQSEVHLHDLTLQLLDDPCVEIERVLRLDRAAITAPCASVPLVQPAVIAARDEYLRALKGQRGTSAENDLVLRRHAAGPLDLRA